MVCHVSEHIKEQSITYFFCICYSVSLWKKHIHSYKKHAHVHTYIDTCIHTIMRACMYACMGVGMHAYMYVCILVHIVLPCKNTAHFYPNMYEHRYLRYFW